MPVKHLAPLLAGLILAACSPSKPADSLPPERAQLLAKPGQPWPETGLRPKISPAGPGQIRASLGSDAAVLATPTSPIDVLQAIRQARAEPATTAVRVFVQDDCQLCRSWAEHWPVNVPVRWQVLGPMTAAWCQPLLADCAATQAPSSQRQRLGIVALPAAIHPDGRMTTGMPDAAWMTRWFDPDLPIAPVPVVIEPDL